MHWCGHRRHVRRLLIWPEHQQSNTPTIRRILVQRSPSDETVTLNKDPIHNSADRSSTESLTIRDPSNPSVKDEMKVKQSTPQIGLHDVRSSVRIKQTSHYSDHDRSPIANIDMTSVSCIISAPPARSGCPPHLTANSRTRLERRASSLHAENTRRAKDACRRDRRSLARRLPEVCFAHAMNAFLFPSIMRDRILSCKQARRKMRRGTSERVHGIFKRHHCSTSRNVREPNQLQFSSGMCLDASRSKICAYFVFFGQRADQFLRVH